jgi:DNA polymerase-1
MTKIKSEVDSLNVLPWPDVLTIDGPVVLYVQDDTVWLSNNEKTAFHKKIDQLDRSVWRIFELVKVISYDSKMLYHQLADYDVFVEFGELHDIHQAAFLINSLQRDRSLTALVGFEVADEPKPSILAIWHLYKSQQIEFEHEPKLSKIAHDFDFPLTHILFKMERRGIKVDVEFLKEMGTRLGKDYHELEQQMFKMVGYEFNIGSPNQLSEVLFTKLQLPTKDIKKGKTGYSTGQKELNKLRGTHPIIELIEQTRELAKLKNTYVDALPLLADKQGRIHTTFNQDVASTGRLSSTNPNLQNIPIRTALGRQIRKAFIPDDDKVFVSADYSQFELRLAAVLAGDEEMINDFNGNVDIHTKTASLVYGVPMDDVTKSQRRNAKVINFGILYGMSPHGLSAATGMSFIEAKKFIDEYFELRKPIRKFINSTLDSARMDGYVETYFGRRRPTPDVLSSNFMIRAGAERAAANMPIQGTEADLMKLAMIEVDKKIEGLGEQILQIHDSILVECPVENAEKISEILQETLENIAPQLGVRLKVDVSTGKNWSEL